MPITRTVITSIDKLDFAALRKQKETLLEIRNHTLAMDIVNDLSGLIHFIDAFQDSAAEKFTPEFVFGRLTTNEVKKPKARKPHQSAMDRHLEKSDMPQ